MLKRLSPIFILVLLFSCSNPVPKPTDFGLKNDTIGRAMFKVKAPNGAILTFIDTVVVQTLTQYVFKDTPTSSGGHWQKDTVNTFGRVTGDTMRDAAHKPIYDSNHHAVFQHGYYQAFKDSIFRVPKGF